MVNVLACLDLSPATRQVLTAALTLTSRLDGNLTLLHVAAPTPDFVGYDVGPDTVRAAVADHLRGEHRELEGWREAARAQCPGTRALMVQGPTIEKIIDHVERSDVQYVVVGSRGTSALHDLITGSVVRGVIQKSAIPVLVVPIDED